MDNFWLTTAFLFSTHVNMPVWGQRQLFWSGPLFHLSLGPQPLVLWGRERKVVESRSDSQSLFLETGTSLLLTFIWAKQALWPSPESRTRTSQGRLIMAIGERTSHKANELVDIQSLSGGMWVIRKIVILSPCTSTKERVLWCCANSQVLWYWMQDAYSITLEHFKGCGYIVAMPRIQGEYRLSELIRFHFHRERERETYPKSIVPSRF